MTLLTICADFCKCGVYPFNPDAIDCSIGVADVDGSDKKVMMTIMTRSLGKHQKV